MQPASRPRTGYQAVGPDRQGWSPADVLAASGLDAATPAVWLLIGPVGTSTTTVAATGDPSLASRIIGGGGAQKCELPTGRLLRPFVGYSLAVLAVPGRLLSSPFVLASPLAFRLTGLAVVYATAGRRSDGPYAEWQLGPDGIATVSYRFPGGRRPTADDLTELARADDLLRGGRRRPGRVPRYADPLCRELAERADALKRRYPSLSYAQIAGRLGLDERTLRRYRAIALEAR